MGGGSSKEGLGRDKKVMKSDKQVPFNTRQPYFEHLEYTRPLCVYKQMTHG